MKLNIGSGTVILDPKEWINIDKNNEDPLAFKLDVESLARSYFIVYTGNDQNPNVLTQLRDITEVRAHHVLEHVEDLDAVMRWIHTICVNGATLDIIVPLANTLWAVANPDHKRLFNHRTFQYYTKEFVTSDLGLFRGFEIISQKIEKEPDEWFEGIQWMVCNLHTKLKVIK